MSIFGITCVLKISEFFNFGLKQYFWSGRKHLEAETLIYQNRARFWPSSAPPASFSFVRFFNSDLYAYEEFWVSVFLKTLVARVQNISYRNKFFQEAEIFKISILCWEKIYPKNIYFYIPKMFNY